MSYINFNLFSESGNPAAVPLVTGQKADGDQQQVIGGAASRAEQSHTSPGSPPTKHFVSEDDRRNQRGKHSTSARVAADWTKYFKDSSPVTIDVVLSFIRPRVAVDDAEDKDAMVQALRAAAVEIKSKTAYDFNAVESRRKLRAVLTRALRIPHVDFTPENPIVAIIRDHFTCKAPTSDAAIHEFSVKLAKIMVEFQPKISFEELGKYFLEYPWLEAQTAKIDSTGVAEETRKALEFIISTSEVLLQMARCLIPWAGDRALSDFAEALTNRTLLSTLGCWHHYHLINGGGERRYYLLENDYVTTKRDYKPIGGLVDPSVQLTGEFDCMGSKIPILCGESGSGKTCFAIRMAKGYVIHGNVGSCFRGLCSFENLVAALMRAVNDAVVKVLSTLSGTTGAADLTAAVTNAVAFVVELTVTNGSGKSLLPEASVALVTKLRTAVKKTVSAATSEGTVSGTVMAAELVTAVATACAANTIANVIVAADVSRLVDGIAEPILFVLRREHGAPRTGDFPLDPGQTLTIVLDEMGAYENVVRALCRHHSAVRKALAKKFGVDEKMLGLIIVGTGTESGANAPGSLPHNYSLHKLKHLPQYWEKHYEALLNIPRLLTQTLAKVVPPVSKLSKRTRLPPIHVLVLRLCGNARFAAIFAHAIQEDKLCTLAYTCGDACAGSESAMTPAAATVALMAVANDAIASLVAANGLSTCKGSLLANMAVAAELVVNGATWERAMRHQLWQLLNRDYGIVTSAAEKVALGEACAMATANTHAVLSLVGEKWTTGYDCRGGEFLAMPRGSPSVQMSELGAAILLLERGLLWVPPGDMADGFEWTVASAVALYCMMPDVNLQDSVNVDATALTPLRLLLNGRVVSDENIPGAAKPSGGREEVRRVQRWACPVQIDYRRMTEPLSTPATTPAWLTSIRTWISGGASVVVINAPMASYADVIVFARGRLVLLQCKSFGGTKLTRDVVNEEFDKMMPPPAVATADAKVAKQVAKRRALTEILIATCLCGAPPPSAFVVEAAIVFEGPSDLIDSSVLPDGKMSATYPNATSTEQMAVSGVPVTFRFHVIDVTRRADAALHGLHPVAQSVWVGV